LATDDAPQTPGKFGYAVDCGPLPVLRATSADIRIERGPAGLILRADGAERGALVTADTAAPAALRLARWFLDSGGAPEGRGRMAAHLARGVALPTEFTCVPSQTNPAPAPGPGPLAQGFLVGFDFGQVQAETLSILAEIGALRITPWRMILIEGARAAPDLPGLIIRPDDPMLRVIACTGAPGCPQALALTRPLARALCSALAPGQLLHVSGCAKGCAHPGPAPLVLVGRAGGTFDLIRDGTAAGPPALSDLSADRLTQFPALLTE
ncbi:MAG: precorrin-3B synthase, partial [Rhodobacteraceae bacterium]|nr:precorrin-3B synthase [Paracoccaceae bacterium]